MSLDGDIGRPMITLHGTLDALLPIGLHADEYERLVREAGNKRLHRYYVIEAGNHVDSYYDRYPDRLRPILPCYRAAFELMERWVESGRKPPGSRFVPKPEGGDVVNSCSIGGVRKEKGGKGRMRGG